MDPGVGGAAPEDLQLCLGGLDHLRVGLDPFLEDLLLLLAGILRQTLAIVFNHVLVPDDLFLKPDGLGASHRITPRRLYAPRADRHDGRRNLFCQLDESLVELAGQFEIRARIFRGRGLREKNQAATRP